MKWNTPNVLLRLSVASVFLYAAIASFIEPLNWIGYFPPFMQHLLPGNLILNVFSVYELILALWILSGKKIFYPSILAALTLAGIIFFNFAVLDIVFRDIAIFFAALALAALSYQKTD